MFGAVLGVFLLPLIWLGFDTRLVLTALTLNLLYQFWIHADWIPRLGWLEYVLNTPSAHRVHHARNPEYLDANFGGVLQVMGAPVGVALGRHAFTQHALPSAADGSVMIVVATDAPLSSRNLGRLASRAMMGLGRTGSSAANGSGDYVIAFSTAAQVRRKWDAKQHVLTEVANSEMSALFHAVTDATEEAVYNALFQATSMSGNGSSVEAIPLDRVREVLRASGIHPPS